MVCADAHRDAEIFRPAGQRREDVVDARQLGVVLGIRVFAHCEFLLVGEVPGIHADLLDVLDGFHRGGRREVNVRDEGHADPAGFQGLTDDGEIVGIRGGRNGDTYDFAAGGDQPRDLLDGRGGIGRRGGGHRLDPDRMVPPEGHIADVHDASATSLVSGQSGVESHRADLGTAL